MNFTKFEAEPKLGLIKVDPILIRWISTVGRPTQTYTETAYKIFITFTAENYRNRQTYLPANRREKKTIGVLCLLRDRVYSETNFDSKQQKLELRLVLALSETKRLFSLFRFFAETVSFGVSIEPKLKIGQPKLVKSR